MVLTALSIKDDIGIDTDQLIDVITYSDRPKEKFGTWYATKLDIVTNITLPNTTIIIIVHSSLNHISLQIGTLRYINQRIKKTLELHKIKRDKLKFLLSYYFSVHV